MRMRWIALPSMLVGLALLGTVAGLALAAPGQQQYETTTVTTTVPGTTTENTTTENTTTESTTTNDVAGAAENNSNNGTAGVGRSNQAPLHSTGTSNSLPFTGTSLTGIVAVGLILVLLGLALRRRGRRSTG